MIYKELYLNLTYNQKVIFAVGIIALVLIVNIIARIKNKTQKRTKKQITRKVVKIDLCDYLISNMKQEFIGQSKVIRNELARM